MRDRRIKSAAIAGAVIALTSTLPDGAVAQPAPSQLAGAPADAGLEAARAAFEGLPEGERQALQEALVWTGDHTGVTTGSFGPRTFAAIQSYQRRAALKPTGVLEGKERAALLAAGKRAREAVKFTALTDPATGIRIGIPENTLPKRGATPNGARWQSADEKITLDTRALPPGEGDLAALFERNTAPAPGRQVIYKVLRPDFFVVSGETATGRFYVRYASGPGGLRGFSVGYDKSLAKEFDRTLIAIANSFVPFPEPAAVAQPVPVPPARPALLPPSAPSGPIATGISVAPGRILTSSSVEGCSDLRAGAAKARLVRADKPAGLALLEIESGGARETSVAVQASPAKPGAAVVVLAFSGRIPALAAAPGEVGSASVIAPLQPGSGGAPVLDRTGALVGLVGLYPTRPREVAGVVPPAAYPMVDAESLARFLGPATLVSPSNEGQRTTGEIAASVAPAMVAITCVR